MGILPAIDILGCPSILCWFLLILSRSRVSNYFPELFLYPAVPRRMEGYNASVRCWAQSCELQLSVSSGNELTAAPQVSDIHLLTELGSQLGCDQR